MSSSRPLPDDDRDAPGSAPPAAPAAVDAASELVGPASHIAGVSSKLSLIGHQRAVPAGAPAWGRPTLPWALLTLP